MELKEQSVVVSEEGPVQSAAEEKEEKKKKNKKPLIDQDLFNICNGRHLLLKSFLIALITVNKIRFKKH